MIEMENRATTTFGYTVQAWRLSLFGQIALIPEESDAKQILTASPLENWRRPPGRPRTTWMKTNQQDLESLNLSLNEATDMAQNRLRLALRTHSGAWQKWMNEWMNNSYRPDVTVTKPIAAMHWKLLRTDKQTDRRTNRQTDGRINESINQSQSNLRSAHQGVTMMCRALLLDLACDLLLLLALRLGTVYHRSWDVLLWTLPLGIV